MIQAAAISRAKPDRHANRSFSARRLISSGFAVFVLLGLAFSAFAQQQPSALPASAAGTGKMVATGPAWDQLTPSQQKALAPLASSWNTGMSEAHKRKWLEISRNYGTLTPQAQATLTSRMNEWVALSPQQRAQARLNFGRTQELSTQLTPEEKKAKWEAYQALSPEEKNKLAAKGAPRPAGAAIAVKPVPPQKLATVPALSASQPVPRAATKISPSTVAPAPAALPGPATIPAPQR
ncbi:MAG: putative transrane protein [Polaromonas sp.]|jgi:hypothetical protein|nr:putative transrane protein [Polaromonas sp.]